MTSPPRLPRLVSAARRPRAGRRCRVGALALLVGLATVRTAAAHSGPAYRIVDRQPAGPYTVSVWVDPDIGAGQVLVQLHAPSGAEPRVAVSAAPLDGHRGALEAVGVRGGPGQPVAADTWLALLPFDAEGTWALTVRLDGPAGAGELRSSLDAVPDGPTAGEAWIYVLPFVLLAGLWVLGRFRHRREGS